MTCQQPLQANPLLTGYPGADEACIPPTDQLSMHAPSFSCSGKECAHSELHQKENQSSWDRARQLHILLYARGLVAADCQSIPSPPAEWCSRLCSFPSASLVGNSA